MIAAVFDATTLLQAATNRRGPAGACLALVDEGHVRLVTSDVALEEIREVLQRPAIRRAFPRLTDQSVQDFLEHIVEKAQKMEHVPAVYRLTRDPDDEPYVDLAIASKAGFLVSRDKDLLDLMKNEEFRNTYQSLSILDPVAFLRHVRAQIAKELGYE